MSNIGDLYAPPLDGQYLGHLMSYLRLKGWEPRDQAGWIEFYGVPDADGEPLMLVLPKDPDSSEAQSYLAKAIDLLSALDDEPDTVTIWRVLHFHNDVFVVRNIDTGIHSSIPIRIAAQQVGELKQLIAFGAKSESAPRPYYPNRRGAGDQVLDQFRFGHTAKGSFALTIEAPIVHNMELFVSDNVGPQFPLLPDFAEYALRQPIEIAPLPRRIVERIMRGLKVAQQATNESNLDLLVSEYGSGFSGNMCRVVAELAKNTGPIEYSVLWSPKIPVADDLREQTSIRLSDFSYTLLRSAADAMRRRQPEEQRVHGIVTHIGSNIPPLGEGEEGRQVIILAEIRQTNRTASIIVPLNREEYMMASNAHLHWWSVEVTGKLERTGSQYRLVDPKDFRIAERTPNDIQSSTTDLQG